MAASSGQPVPATGFPPPQIGAGTTAFPSPQTSMGAAALPETLWPPTRGHDRYSAGRIVNFSYTPNQVYTLLCRPAAVTDIVLPPGEELVTLAVGDTTRWVHDHDATDIFLKPVAPGLYTSATLITTTHRYQFLLVSVGQGAPWYQQVSFGNASAIAARAAPTPAKHQSPTIQANDQSAGPEHLDTAYRIDGNAPFRPVSVYDDGSKTYLRLPKHLQTMPALFVFHDGKTAVVNYRVAGDVLVYPHLFHKAELRIGETTIKIIKLDGQH
jgi:type IV secretion system protein VirB9